MFKQSKEAVYRCHVRWMLRPEIKFIWFCGFVMMPASHYIGKRFNRTCSFNEFLDTEITMEKTPPRAPWASSDRSFLPRLVLNQSKNRSSFAFSTFVASQLENLLFESRQTGETCISIHVAFEISRISRCMHIEHFIRRCYAKLFWRFGVTHRTFFMPARAIQNIYGGQTYNNVIVVCI